MRSIVMILILVATGCRAEYQWKSTLERADHSVVERTGRCAETADDPGVIACSDHPEHARGTSIAGSIAGTIAGLGALALLGMIGAVANAPVH